MRPSRLLRAIFCLLALCLVGGWDTSQGQIGPYTWKSLGTVTTTGTTLTSTNYQAIVIRCPKP